MYKAKNKSGYEHVFSQVPEANIPRSVFNRSHSWKATCDANYIIPFYADEALPGDTFTLRATLFGRMATPIAPIMDNLYVDVFYFAVPLRLVWSNFKYFMGEKVNPSDSTSYSIPQIVSPDTTGWTAESLSDYLGLPIGVPGLSVSCMWHRAYNRIYAEWFRDENLINSPTLDTGDAASTNANHVLLKRGKRKDYFTSALPWPQKGTAVSIPLGTTAPVIGVRGGVPEWQGLQAVGGFPNGTGTYSMRAKNDNDVHWGLNSGSNTDLEYLGLTADKTKSWMVADLSNATAATINSLRQAFQLQKLMERDARGGTRYTEIIKAHFGVTSPDARLQRPEYLGGSTANVNITPVPQLSSTTGSYAQGRMAGYGTVAASNVGFTKSFTEHCVILGLFSIRADLTYQQGINKMFLRSTKYDFYWPALATIGEQTILNKEIYAQGTGHESDDNGVFGYQERYAEYRYKPSQICGKLRSTYSSPLDVWHLAQKFTSLPTLEQTFIEEAVPMARVSAVSGEPPFIMDAYIDCRCARPMPVYSVPGLIDHF